MELKGAGMAKWRKWVLIIYEYCTSVHKCKKIVVVVKKETGRNIPNLQVGRGPFLESLCNLPGPISIFLNVFSPIKQ